MNGYWNNPAVLASAVYLLVNANTVSLTAWLASIERISELRIIDGVNPGKLADNISELPIDALSRKESDGNTGLLPMSTYVPDL